jgi:hypothetical protein
VAAVHDVARHVRRGREGGRKVYVMRAAKKRLAPVLYVPCPIIYEEMMKNDGLQVVWVRDDGQAMAGI